MADEATQDTADAGADDAPQGGQDRTFTQADLDRIVQERLGKERQKYQGFDDLKAKAEEFDKLQEAQRTDLERLQAERDELKSKLTPLETENLRLRVATSKQLPAQLVNRLQGGTQEEMEADADELLKLVSPPAQTGPDFGGGARTSVDPDDDMNSRLRRALGH